MSVKRLVVCAVGEGGEIVGDGGGGRIAGMAGNGRGVSGGGGRRAVGVRVGVGTAHPAKSRTIKPVTIHFWSNLDAFIFHSRKYLLTPSKTILPYLSE
jgi:hypothetical protein